MPEISTKQLVEEVDAAVLDAYKALRTALHKLEDVKLKNIRQPEPSPFGQEHEEMHKMFLDLWTRYQATREEVRDRAGVAQPQPRVPTPEPAPRVEEPPVVKAPSPFVKRMKSRPYVLVPPPTSIFRPFPKSVFTTPPKPPAVAEETEPKGKRKAMEIRKGIPSDSDSELAVENYLSAKKPKTHHNGQEVDDETEVVVIEDSERFSSPLTELSSSSPPPQRPPHVTEIPSTSVSRDLEDSKPTLTPALAHQQKPGPAPPRASESGQDTKELIPGSGTPHTTLEPLPTLGIRLASPASSSKGPPVVSGPIKNEEKASINIDEKPKLKGKKKGASDFTMDDALRDRRLLAVGPDIAVDNDRITHQHVGPNSRATMSLIFGGNPQRMISYPSSEKKRTHGFNSPLLFPSCDFNPLLPTKLGERGLLFRLDQKLEQWVDNEGGVGPYHLMMHYASNDYFYCGVYQFVKVDPISRDEWLAQSSRVKDNWVDHALRTNTGEQTRARVFLRRELGREPTEKEVNAIKKDKSLKGRVTAAQIMGDLNSGIEQLVVWGMKCIDYDYDFEKYLADNLVAANAGLKKKRKSD